MKSLGGLQKGVGVVGLLLAVVVIAAVAGAGLFVYEHQNKKSSMATSTLQPKADPYTGWKSYCDNFYHYCFKYPQDWALSVNSTPTKDCETGQVSLLNSSKSVEISYTNDDPHDVGLFSFFPVSVADLPTANQAASLIGGYLTANYSPRYQVVDNATLASYPLTVGTLGQFPNNPKFADKGTEPMTCGGSFVARPTTDVTNAADAQAWFDTNDAKNSMLVMKSFIYKPNP